MGVTDRSAGTETRAAGEQTEPGSAASVAGLPAGKATESAGADQSFNRLFQASPAPVLVLAPDAPRFTIKEVNKAYLHATMRTREELVGRALFDAFPDNPDDATTEGVSTLRASLERVLATREPDELPILKYDIARPDGSFEERWWRPINSAVLDEHGQVEAIIHNANDVTDHRRAEQALRESEERLRLVIDAATDYAIFTTDPERRVTSWSEGAARVFGYPADEAIGMCADELWTPEDRSTGQPEHEAETADREGCAEDKRWHQRSDGGRVFLNGSVHPLPPGNDGRERGFIKIARDETARHASDAALSESEARYRTLFNAIEAGFCIVEMKFDEAGHAVDYRMIEVNPAFERQTGLADAAGRWVSELAPGLERHWFETYGRVARTGEPVRFENGADVLGERWFDVFAFPTGGAGSNRVAILFTDISDRRRAETALRDSEARLEAITDSVDQLIWSTQPDGYHDYYNRRWYEYTGVPAGSTDGEAWNGMFHPDDQERAWAVWRHCLETGEPYHIEYRLRHRSGQYRWVIGRAQPVRGTDGAIKRWYGTCTDIHDLKVAEARVRETEERHRIALEATNDAIWDWDLVSNSVRWNEALTDAYGHRHESVQPTGDWWIGHIHPEDAPRIDASIHAVIDGNGDRWTEQYRFRRADGSYAEVLDRGRVVRGPDGRALRMIGAMLDLSRLREAESALRESEDRYRTLFNTIDEGFCVIEFVDGPEGPLSDYVHVSANPAYEKHAGIANVVGQRVREMVPAEADDWVARYREVLLSGEPIRFERELEATGRHLELAAFRVGEAERRQVAVLFQDITARKRIEAALSEERGRLETLNRTGAALAGELDLDRVVQMVTDAGVELIGAQFGAFFYNVTQDSGENMMLFTLSGAERSQFDFGMPRPTAVFSPTFAGECVIRSEDILVDPRYGKSAPHHGMPKGHLPVRSYLAVPVTSRSGEVIGGLMFGHPEPGRFTAAHEGLMTGIAAQAAIAIDNARLFDKAQRDLAERVRAEEELKRLNETLESRVEEEVSQRAEAEERLRQAQKMETVGQLTGGVAHDFNNLLQVVTGNLEILLRNLPEDMARLRRSADNAMKGAQRAATLTQRLLAFSRRQPLAPKPAELNKLVAGMSELLHRTLGETVEVETVLAPRLWRVEVDTNQLENAILNLAVNARDAMEGGGKLTIETSNTHLDHRYTADNSEVSPGQYVVVCVSDTGVGMSADTVARAFEPFFTTKDVGRGTGLGLSMVYGFVKQSGGHLKIYSEPGEGTTVKIYLPRFYGSVEEAVDETEQVAPEGTRGETVLVCEDDADVRGYSMEVLRELGYRVLEAEDGPAALRIVERTDERIDLLFTDVVLPGGMTGAVLAEAARRARPGLKVLFTTGYARNAIVHHGRLDAGVELITKPFSYADLAARVRDLLDAPAV